MAQYRVVTNFKDLQDGGYFYTAGDTYPRDNRKVTKKRLRRIDACLQSFVAN